MVQTLQNFINGKFVTPAGTTLLDVVNPTNGDVVAQAPVSVQADVDAAKRIGARGTPTLVINGVMLASMPAPDSLEALIGLAERGLLK